MNGVWDVWGYIPHELTEKSTKENPSIPSDAQEALGSIYPIGASMGHGIWPQPRSSFKFGP